MSLSIASDHRAAVHPLLAAQRSVTAEKVTPKSRDLGQERKDIGRGPKAAPATVDHVRPEFAREVMNGADSIVSTVRDGVDALADTVGADDAARDAIARALDGFQTRVKETAYASAGGTALDAEGTTTAFAAAFDDLRAALEEILSGNETKTAPAASAVDLATAPSPRDQLAKIAADPGLDPPLGESGSDLFDALGEAFDAQLQALVDTLQGVLAPLTPGFDATA
ncbi:MAG: hypothetical protein GY715_15030 [Planctomycetes bacterium]|nr:hypothetical protein [Planctomycetota bacterium]